VKTAAIAILVAVGLLMSSGQSWSQPAEVIPDRYIVQFSDDVTDVEGLARNLARRHGGVIRHVFARALKGCAITLPPGLSSKVLFDDPRVIAVEQDRAVTIPKPIPQQIRERKGPPPGKGGGKGRKEGQVIPTGIDRIDAEINLTEGSNGVVVAVLDTGIDLDHPDLPAIIYGVDFTGENGTGDDNNSARGVKGHGTHVAGVIAALDNDIGVLGVGSQLGLYAVKVLDRHGSGYLSDIIAGVEFVTANKDLISVANMSLSGQLKSDIFHSAIQSSVEAGVVYVVAAGNDSGDVYGPDGIQGTDDDHVPAAYDEVITVSALDDRDGTPENDKFASFSNFGEGVDMIAPGVKILSTSNNGETSSLNGTSFSAPHVAGVAALYIFVEGKPIDETGVQAVRDSLLFYGEQAPAGGWPGDPDGTAEPLVDANAVNVDGTGE